MALIAAGHADGWPVGGGRLAVDRRRARRGPARARRQDRDRRAGQLARRARRPRRRRLRPRPRRRRRDRRRAASRPGRPRLPPLQARAGAFKVDLAVEGGVPWTAEACRARRHRPRGRLLRGAGRGRARHQPRSHAGAPVRPGRPAVPRRPPALRRRRPPDLGLRPRAERLRRRRRDAPCSTRSNASPPACASASSPPRPAHRPSSRRTTPTTSAATSSPAPTTPGRCLIRPRLALDPYSTGVPGLFICSAATPPGGGVHGMGGYNAAQSALRHLGRG